MIKLDIAVCDDINQEAEVLMRYIKKYFEEKKYTCNITRYRDARELLFAIEDYDFDAIFLDIFMEKTNGMDVAYSLRKRGYKGKIIFQTTTSDYAIESYDVKASGYLLKPIKYEKISSLLDSLEFDKLDDRVYIYQRNRAIRLIKYSEIVFIDSKNHVIRFHLNDGTVLEEFKQLTKVQEIINDEDFLRTHQSYLINMNHIKSVDEDFNMDSGDRVLIKKKDKKAIKEHYYEWLMRNGI